MGRRWSRLGAVALFWAVSAAAVASPFHVPDPVASEARADALPEGDPRRPASLLDAALLRHAAAEAAEAEERAAHADDLRRWRARVEVGLPGAPPALATPRADALRAEALRLAQRALDASGPVAAPAEALLLGGLEAQRLGLRRDALRLLGRLVRDDPEGPLAGDAWLALGEQHLRQGDATRAWAAFVLASRSPRAGTRGTAFVRRAEVALAARDAAGAVAALERALGEGAPEALALADELLARPLALGEAAGLLADLAERAGEPERALALRRSALPLARGPAAAAARAAIARAERAVAVQRPPLALPAGLPARRAGPAAGAAEAPAALRLAAFRGDPAALHALGRAALEAGRAGPAGALLARALAAAPAGAAAAPLAVDLAAARVEQGDAEGARRVLDDALARDPTAAPALEARGALALALGDPAAAAADLARAAQLEPGRWQGRLLEALALEAQGRVGEAAAAARVVLALAPDQPEALRLAASAAP